MIIGSTSKPRDQSNLHGLNMGTGSTPAIIAHQKAVDVASKLKRNPDTIQRHQEPPDLRKSINSFHICGHGSSGAVHTSSEGPQTQPAAPGLSLLLYSEINSLTKAIESSLSERYAFP